MHVSFWNLAYLFEKKQQSSTFYPSGLFSAVTEDIFSSDLERKKYENALVTCEYGGQMSNTNINSSIRKKDNPSKMLLLPLTQYLTY